MWHFIEKTMFGLYFLNKTDLQDWKHFVNLLIGEVFHLMSLYEFDVSLSQL